MRFFAAILLFLCPAMASAGIKATYADSGQQIVIEVADSGDSRIEEKGRRTLLGREGVLLAVTERSEGTSAKPQLFLVNRDEDLKPVGRALEQFTYSFYVLLGGLTGPTPPAEMTKIKSLFALGTPLEIEGSYKMVALEKAEIDAARVVLPGKPQTVAEIRAGMKVTAVESEAQK